MAASSGGKNAIPPERLARLAAFPPEVWDEYQLLKDPLCRRLDSGQRRELVRLAATAAAAALENLRRSFGELSPTDYAARLNIAIDGEGRSDGGRPPFLSLAVRKPPTIIISSRALDLAVERIRAANLAAVWDTAIGWSGIAIAHELFHHIEWREQSLAVVVPEITTFRFGPIHLRGRPVAAEEIAAMRFSQLLSGCPARPDALEIIYLAATNPPVAASWLERLEELAGGEGSQTTSTRS